jgi:hypothetical protein
MVVLIVILIVIGTPVVIGFRKSLGERRLDRRRLAAFIGYSIALFAICTAILWLVAGQVQTPTRGQQATVFVIGVTSNISSAAALVCGILSGGSQRTSLITFGIVMQFIYVLGAFSNFGA